MSNINIKIFFKKRKQRLSIFGFSPTFDWKVIFAISFLFFVGGIIYSSLLYYKITNGSVFNVINDVDKKSEIIQKEADIDKVIKTLVE